MNVDKLETLCTFCGNAKIVKPLWKKVWWFLKKLNVQLSYKPATPLLGTDKNWPKGIESRDSKKYLYS